MECVEQFIVVTFADFSSAGFLFPRVVKARFGDSTLLNLVMAIIRIKPIPTIRFRHILKEPYY